MAENYTKKQHHIPRFLLKNFTDQKGDIWVLDKKTGKIFRSKPENIACKNHLYSVHYADHKDDWLEKRFSELEGKASPILAKMLQNRNWSESLQETEFIINFLCILMQRDPIECTKDICNEETARNFFLKNMDKVPITQFIKMKKYFSERAKGEALRDTFFSASRMFCNIINENFHLCGLYFSEQDTIIVSDKYQNIIQVSNVEKLKTPNFLQEWKYILLMICPLSSRAVVVFINKQMTRQWADEFLKRIGEDGYKLWTVAQASRFVYGSDKKILEHTLESYNARKDDGFIISI